MSIPQPHSPRQELTIIIETFDHVLSVKSRDLLATIAELGGTLTTPSELAERAAMSLRHCKRLLKQLADLGVVCVENVNRYVRRFTLAIPEPAPQAQEPEADPLAGDLTTLGIDSEMYLATCETAAPQLKKNRVKIVLQYLDIGGKVRDNLSRWAEALRDGNEAIKAITPALRWMKIWEFQEPPQESEAPPQGESSTDAAAPPRRSESRPDDSKHKTLFNPIYADGDKELFNRFSDFEATEPESPLDSVWQDIINTLQLPPSIIKAHFLRSEAILVEGVLHVTAPPKSAEWLRGRLLGLLERAVRRVCGEGVKTVITGKE